MDAKSADGWFAVAAIVADGAAECCLGAEIPSLRGCLVGLRLPTTMGASWTHGKRPCVVL